MLLHSIQTNNWIFIQAVIMTLYVKGFKIDRQKVADIIKAPRGDPIVDTGISVVVEQLNRSAYISIEVGYEPPSADGQRHLALIIALEIDDDEERLKKKELGTVDESIRAALPHTLVGPDVWELYI
jgi:hypothetical protein